MSMSASGAMGAAAGPAAGEIQPAAGDIDIATIRALFLEYADGLGFSLCFQKFDDELASLPGDYAPPTGGLWIARVDGAIAGCVGLRPLEPGIGEIKRLYLRPAFRGLRLGRRMAETAIATARQSGCRAIRLDTVDEMTEAQSLYRALGFRERPPYGSHRHPRLRYFELALDAASR